MIELLSTAVKTASIETLKERLLTHLKGLILERISEAEVAIHATRESRDSDTKSTAGDKHEVGRAMIQIELDNQAVQLEKNKTLLAELERIPLERVYEKVEFGSLVCTNNGIYFMSIGIGQVRLDDEVLFVISMASPIAEQMRSLQVAEGFEFNGKAIEIQDIR